jgi:hypothetical protein
MNVRLGVAATLAALIAVAAGAQEEPPDVPAGDGVIRGRLMASDAVPVGEALVILYSLTPEGEPGLRRGQSDAQGIFAFEGISTDPRLVYLVGTRVGGVPFGTRAAFRADQKELRVEIPVSLPSEDASRLAPDDVRLRFAIGCTHLRVQQTHVLRNDSKQVLFVAPEHRESAKPLFEAALPPGAEGFELMLAAGADSLERSGDQLRFWGPLHPGRHEIEWGYGLPLAEKIDLHLPLPSGAPHVNVLTPAAVRARGEGLRSQGERTLSDGRYTLQATGRIAAGSAIDLALELPPAPLPTSRPKVEEVRLWLELDDVALDVSEEHLLKTRRAACRCSACRCRPTPTTCASRPARSTSASRATPTARWRSTDRCRPARARSRCAIGWPPSGVRCASCAASPARCRCSRSSSPTRASWPTGRACTASARS